MKLPDTLIQQLCQEKEILKAVLSCPVKGSTRVRVSFRPVAVKGEERLQMEEEYPTKVFHKNLNWNEAVSYFLELLNDEFQEAHLFAKSGDFHLLKSKNKEWKLIKKRPSHLPVVPQHNRAKKYLIDPSSPFWQKLDVTDKKGAVKPSMQAKFRQVERFLEIASDLLKKLPKKDVLRIVDFGCGKSYLTFALAEWLKMQSQPSEILGIDLKEDVVKNLNTLANDLGYAQLKFEAGAIQDFQLSEEGIDLVISLHACDTATDELLAKAVKAQAKAILSVPCCQHELFKQIEQPLLNPLLKHGILKERFSALVTDACRSALLEQAGYHTQVLEFIDTEHTPKNLLIRAVKGDGCIYSKDHLSEFLEFLHIHPKLLRLLRNGDTHN
ncbi:MAG: class I SAM-dependent methyltransferase [Parachlamydiaceae bacterium]